MEARYFYQTAILIYDKNNSEFTPNNAECYMGLAQLFKQEPIEFNKYRKQEEVRNELSVMYTNLIKVIEIYEFLLGVEHPTTKDNYAKLALAYRENGDFESAQKIVNGLKRIS